MFFLSRVYGAGKEKITSPSDKTEKGDYLRKPLKTLGSIGTLEGI